MQSLFHVFGCFFLLLLSNQSSAGSLHSTVSQICNVSPAVPEDNTATPITQGFDTGPKASSYLYFVAQQALLCQAGNIWHVQTLHLITTATKVCFPMTMKLLTQVALASQVYATPQWTLTTKQSALPPLPSHRTFTALYLWQGQQSQVCCRVQKQVGQRARPAAAGPACPSEQQPVGLEPQA